MHAAANLANPARCPDTIDRGTVVPADRLSEIGTANAHALYQASEKAMGRKTSRGMVDPVHQAQVEQLLAQQQSALNCGIPEELCYHKARSKGYSVTEWEAWLYKREEGVNLARAASIRGTSPLSEGSAEERKAALSTARSDAGRARRSATCGRSVTCLFA